MTTPASGKAAPTKPQAQSGQTAKSDSVESKVATSTEAHAEAVSSPQVRYVLIGKLRRDTMIFDSGTDLIALTEQASASVRQGRASETFVIEAKAYFSESEIDFQQREAPKPAQYADQAEDRPALLNPATGEQALDVAQADSGSAPKVPQPTQGADSVNDRPA